MMKNNNSGKQLLTKEFIEKINYNNEYFFDVSIKSLTLGLLITVLVLELLVYKFGIDKTLYNVGLSIIVAIILSVFLYFLCFRKSIKAPYKNMNYYIVDDILLSKFFGTAKKPTAHIVGRWLVRRWLLNTFYRPDGGVYRGYCLRFLNSGDFILPSKKYNKHYFKNCILYDFAKREDRFYVLVDSNGIINDVFDKRLFDISPEDFELIENKYYSKK